MATGKKTIEEVERLLKDIGEKIDELIEKGKKMSGEAGDEIDKKIDELKGKKWDLEQDFEEMKRKFQERFEHEREHMDPKLKKSGQHFKAAFFELNEAIKALFSK
jgi:F0F1-type ATP synthase membrane subunit b/b'